MGYWFRRSASALAVGFLRLLEPLSCVRFDIIKDNESKLTVDPSLSLLL